MLRASAFDADKYRDNPKMITKYLNKALTTGDAALITKAIGNMIRAQGVTSFSQKAGMRRDSLYRTFRGERSPRFETVVNALRTLDIQLIANPSAAVKSSG